MDLPSPVATEDRVEELDVLRGVVLFGVGPGLALAGRIGTLAVVALVVIAYAGQILLSHWWLARFAYVPSNGFGGR